MSTDPDRDRNRELMCALYQCELQLEGHRHSSGEHRDDLEDVVESIRALRKKTQPTHFFGDGFR